VNIDKARVLTAGISVTSVEQVASLIASAPPQGLTVAVSNVQSVMMVRTNPEYAEAHDKACVATSDGMPLVWAMRMLGHPGQERVEGYRLTSRAIELGLEKGTRHYFYGSTPATLERLTHRLAHTYPGIQIVGTHAPPFGPLTDSVTEDVVNRVRASGADVLWIGMGLPKQDVLMARVHPHLPGVSICAVGAVFDWLAGNVPKAPDWMQGMGLEWLFRLSREPRRLWRRYIFNNPAYLALLARQVISTKLRGER
jgi:N-acetylglucosaminyldiphosphoundecaprenol N-acetyl-beta-D-mannosaminyltransferase